LINYLNNDTSIYTQDILVDGVGISKNNNALANQIHLFPNLAKDELHSNFTSFETENNVLLQVDKLQIGYYFLTIDNDIRQSIEKFMV
jgi:hypothetical protein